MSLSTLTPGSLFMSIARFCLLLMHVLEYIFDKISGIYRFNNYRLIEKTYTAMLHVFWFET